jgi:putative transposase
MHGEAQISPQKNSKNSEFKKVLCRFCKSKNTIKRGKRKTQNRGLIQRYFCKDCKKRFTANDGFFRMRNNPEKITFCLDAYFRGMSLRKLQENLEIFQGKNSHYSTILRWIQKYCKQIGEFTDKLKLNISPSIQLDEMEFKTKGKDSWFIDIIDVRTRYIVASNYEYSRNPKELRKVLKKAKDSSNTDIFIISTDALQGYSKCIRSLWHYSKQPRHYEVKSSSKKFNWRIERLHNSIRERTKIMRQFNQLESAKSIMKGYEIFYNFCRKHQAIKKYPYELATDLKLGKNKWLDLVRLSC